MTKETNIVDVRVDNHGSIAVVTPITPTAKEWVEENVTQNGGPQYWGGGIVVEPRFLADLVTGMESDGLVIG